LRRRVIDSGPFFVAGERQGFPLLVRAHTLKWGNPLRREGVLS
jgi:hypothetical protein